VKVEAAIEVRFVGAQKFGDAEVSDCGQHFAQQEIEGARKKKISIGTGQLAQLE
jgi:hypothetical protein